jgi:hypothetical protein
MGVDSNMVQFLCNSRRFSIFRVVLLGAIFSGLSLLSMHSGAKPVVKSVSKAVSQSAAKSATKAASKKPSKSAKVVKGKSANQGKVSLSKNTESPLVKRLDCMQSAILLI